VRRLLINPLTSAILLALLLADLWFLPFHQSMGGYSLASAFLHYRIVNSPSLRYQPRVPHDAYFIRGDDHPGRFRVLHPNDDSWDQATRDLNEHPRDCLEISWQPITLRRGLWAPTTQVDRHKLAFRFGENFSDTERAAARRQFVEESGAADILSFKDFQTLTTTDIDRTRPIYLGHAHNTLAAIAFLAFLASLAWIPKAPSWVRARIGERRLSRGLCPRCRYNLHGLREPKCPECGAPTISGGVPT
jgi:hypothetical protein